MLSDLTESRAAAAAYAALAEFERLAALLPIAPGLVDRMAVAEVIALRRERFRDLLGRLGGAGSPQPVMKVVAPLIDDALRRVESVDWWEALATVALSAPLTDELFELLGAENPARDPSGAAAGESSAESDVADEDQGANQGEGEDAVIADRSDPAAWAAQRLRAAIGEDPVLAARIAMWGRRLVGEAIVLAREFGGERYPELADRLAVNHARRLGELGVAG